MVDGYPGDQRPGAVAAGHAKQIRATGHGVPDQNGHIDLPRAVQNGHLGAQRTRLGGQVEPDHLPAA